MQRSTDMRRVVVADDSRLMRRILADALGRQGFDVVATAADGDEALAACREHRPDAHDARPAHARHGRPRRAPRAARRAGPSRCRSSSSPPSPPPTAPAPSTRWPRAPSSWWPSPASASRCETFAAELGRKVGEAAHSGRVRRPAARRDRRAGLRHRPAGRSRRQARSSSSPARPAAPRPSAS